MDCVVWLATFFGCLCISIDVGLAMGLSLGLVFLFVRTAFPKFASLQQLPGSVAYRDAELYNLQASPLPTPLPCPHLSLCTQHSTCTALPNRVP